MKLSRCCLNWLSPFPWPTIGIHIGHRRIVPESQSRHTEILHRFVFTVISDIVRYAAPSRWSCRHPVFTDQPPAQIDTTHRRTTGFDVIFQLLKGSVPQSREKRWESEFLQFLKHNIYCAEIDRMPTANRDRLKHILLAWTISFAFFPTLLVRSGSSGLFIFGKISLRSLIEMNRCCVDYSIEYQREKRSLLGWAGRWVFTI